MDARQHNLFKAVLRQTLYLSHNLLRLSAADRASRIGNDAVGAILAAPILNFQIGSCSVCQLLNGKRLKYPLLHNIGNVVFHAVCPVIRPEDLDIVPRGEGKLKGVVKSVLFKGVHYETMVETKVGTEITVKMAVSNDSPVYNEAANEKMSANDFYLDMEDVEELDEATIIARADAQAWNPDEDEFISIKEVDYDIKKENGKYPVTFSTAAGTSVTVNMIVKDENRVTSTENEEEIYAMNFFKKVDEIQEAVALDTDLKTWANASAWSLEDDTAVEITDVKYDFDPETITPGIYDVTFATKGYEYKIDTTDKFEVGDEVGLTFQPEDIHIMSKNNY